MPRDWLPREDKLIAFLRAQRNIIPSHLWLMSVDGATQVSGPDWKKGSSQGLVASTKGGHSHKGASCGSCSCASSLDVGRSLRRFRRLLPSA